MKKQKKSKRSRLKNINSRQSSRSQVVEIKPETVIASARRAEKHVIPIIKEHQIPPDAALILLTQYTHAFATNKSQHSLTSAMVLTSQILEFWKAGDYTPSLEYPYTLAETLEDAGLEETTHDYATSFQPFLPLNGEVPRGVGQILGGLVKHPQTHLWQIWIIFERECIQLSAHRDPTRAQKGLAALISLSGTGGSTFEIKALYNSLLSQGDDVPRQIPFHMIQYLLDHIDLYKIEL